MPVDYSAAPPVKRAPGRPRKEAAPVAPKVDPRLQKYESTLGDIRDLAVAVTMMVGWDADAGALQIHTPAALPVYAECAAEIEPIGKFLDGFDQVGGRWVKLVMVSAPLVLQLLANHGALKPSYGGMFNTQPPELLRAQILAEKAKVAQRVQDQMRSAQAEAEEIMRGLDEQPAA